MSYKKRPWPRKGVDWKKIKKKKKAGKSKRSGTHTLARGAPSLAFLLIFGCAHFCPEICKIDHTHSYHSVEYQCGMEKCVHWKDK